MSSSTTWLVLAAVVVLVAVLVARAVRVRSLRHQQAAAAEALHIAAGTVVVLVHGLMGFDAMPVGKKRRVAYFRGIGDYLTAAGATVHTPRLPMLGSVPDRAAALVRFVRELPHAQVTLIGHSMGGLDARYAVSVLGLHDRVQRVVTIGSPHRGTPIADAYQRWGRLVGWLAVRAGLRADALYWLTTTRMATFDAEVPDHPSVSYACVVARTRAWHLWMTPHLLVSYLYLRLVAGPNDGLVPAESQRWGTTLAEIEADHLAQIGWSLINRAPAWYGRIVGRGESR